ncbi:TonB-dependent receptor [Pseudoxanthomonas sangjuensis]|uniref:TonB-dependent receptor n=1 Tax=Pseudoxanthomonas sangjuensis TaxID=1503750 RepID=UPI001390F7E7|nr:TonB-dependent receptor [Pseudoxanthomonas sangjuensis]KAF1715141.1 TonB-dependent receptor [Pseudoxanthomonas sangjuensis]
MIVSKPQCRLLSLAVLAALCALSQAHAQEAAPAAPDEKKDEPTTLATMTVTAQKRVEAAQDVPIAVTALSEQLLQDTSVRDIKDMQILVPGLTVTSTQNEAITTARIRGIGTVGDNVGLESSVGVVIDGVYRPRNSVGFGDLGQLERIEVLKGPQGTLFGKNTSAGVINVVTRKPSYSQLAEGEVTVGNYGALGVAGSYNDALGDNIAFSVYAAKRKRDGWMDVETGAGPRTETDDYDQNFHTVRGKLLLEPTDNVEILLAGDFTSREENCCTAVQLISGSTAPLINALGGGNAIAIPADPWKRLAYSNRSTAQDIKDKGVQAQVDWNLSAFGGATLTSITAVRDWQAINGRDFDFSTADLIYMNPDEDESFNGFETFSQELRLTGATDKVDWLVGLFYADEDLDRTESYRIGPAYEPYLSIGLLSRINPALATLPNAATFLADATGRAPGTVFAGLGALDKYKQNAKNAAIFTNNTWHATDALDLTLGLRYTHEKKTLDAVYDNPNGSPGCASYFGPAGISQAAIGRIAAALTARGVPFASLPPATQQSLIGNIVSFSCLPWTNVLHDGRTPHQEREEKEWSGTLKAAYRWNEHVMTYASAARGYKAGGFNLDRTQAAIATNPLPINPTTADTSFPGEFVDSYELGAKTTWADGNLLLNATLFHQTYDDFQLNSFLGTSFVVRSIPEVVSQGLDSEILWQPKAAPGLMLQAGLMYADTKYGDDIPGSDFVYPGPLYKLPGAQMSFAPKWSGSASATYDWDFGASLVGRFNIGAKYMSEYNTGSDLDAEKLQDAYTVVNARFVVGARNKRWSVELWGTNIFDEDYVQVGFDGPLQALGTPEPGNPGNTYDAFLGAPAMYGVTFRINYH